MSLAEGTLVAHRYRLGSRLGRGGAASAYRALDLVTGDEVALKLLDAELPPASLQREFERLRELVHPHLTRVRAFHVTQLGGATRALYTADLVRGGDLRAFIAKRGFARQPVCDVLDALHTLHRLGLRHGDVKPENVLIDERGRAVLIDLGCAAPLGQASAMLSGTPGYWAPELRAGAAADERADLFAFGVMLRELGADHASLVERLTATEPHARPSSAREVLSWLGDTRDVEASGRGRAPCLVGRERELAHARALLQRVARAEEGPRVLWIEGAPGVGRSRFLRELGFALLDEPLAWVEARAPVSEALSRTCGPLPAGSEALLDQVEELAETRRGTVLVLDDAQSLDAEARAELALVLRALPANGRLAAVIASTEPAPVAAERILLAGLERPAVDAWAGTWVSEGERDALLRFTGGFPRYLERTLAAIQEGRAVALTGAGEVADVAALRVALSGLDALERRSLAEAAVLGAATRPSQRLFQRDLLCWRGERAQLAREADRQPLLGELDARMVRELHARAARACTEPAAAVEHFVRAGLVREAKALLGTAAAQLRTNPRAAIDAWSDAPGWMSPDELVFAAELARRAGEARRALTLLAHALRRRAGVALWLEAAEVYLALGRPKRALYALARAADVPDELRARVLVRAGEYAQALSIIARASAPDARLHEAAGLAEAYLGNFEAAHERLARARELAEDVRARARCLSLSGFVALRAGHVAEAARAYADALAVAEPAGLMDLVANALANLASARQSLGQWGAALTTYERALRLARALGRRGS
ncbi:MAG TPA: serine/threonine-protein kinase, partial [Polyangiales bacterium]